MTTREDIIAYARERQLPLSSGDISEYRDRNGWPYFKIDGKDAIGWVDALSGEPEDYSKTMVNRVDDGDPFDAAAWEEGFGSDDESEDLFGVAWGPNSQSQEFG